VAGPIEELRTLASTVPAHGAALAPYLEKVRTGAYTVTDQDVAELRRAGLSEDEIFEATVAVAAAEGMRRLDAAARVIG
jgi:alkylhydroperoxidase family enzyme